MAGETEVIVVISLGELRPAGTPMGIMAGKTGDFSLEMRALLVIDPLLMMGLGMGFRISP